MDIYDAISARHSIRVFMPDPVDRAVVQRVLDAANAAPSSQNSQPWHFDVATGDARDEVAAAMALSTVHLQEYIDILPPAKIEAAERFFATLGNAPVVVAVSVPTAQDDLSRINGYVAAGCAIQNLMLAARAEGLGTCAVTFSFWVRETIAEILGVGEDREIVSLLLVGHPAETPLPSERRPDAVTFHE